MTQARQVSGPVPPSLAGPSRPVWREENSGTFGQTMAAAARQLGLAELAVHKDYWACQALRAITQYAPGGVVFKGGTSLEKMRLISRFSEDLDLLVVAPFPSKRGAENGLKKMCAAAAGALPGCRREKKNGGGAPGSFHRSEWLHLNDMPGSSGLGGLADPGAILVELGQTGGPNPSSPRFVESLFGRRLAEVGVPTADYADLTPFEVEVLHPGRTLIEKLLRVNNYAVDPGRRAKADVAARIGRQMYDIWALLGSAEVLALLADTGLAAEITADCMRVSESIEPDCPLPLGGFAECPVFDPDHRLGRSMAVEHSKAMRDLYYGPAAAPTYEQVTARVREHAALLILTPGASAAANHPVQTAKEI